VNEREEQFIAIIEAIRTSTLDAIEDMNHAQGSELNQILAIREESIKALGAFLETSREQPGPSGYATEREMLLKKQELSLKELHDLDLFMTTLASEKMEEIKNELRSVKTERILQNYNQDLNSISNRIDVVQ